MRLFTVPGIRLIASDYDGTLAYRGKVIPALGADLAAALGPDRMFAIVTGRPLNGLLQALESSELPKNAYPQALICEERDIHIWHHDAYQPLLEHNQSAFSQEIKLLPVTRHIVAELRSNWPAVIADAYTGPDTDLAPFEQSTPEAEDERGYVELRFANSNVSRTVLAALHEKANTVPNLMLIRNGRLITFRHAAFGKGRILDILRRHLGLQAAEVMAVGDSGNDLSMLGGNYGFHAAAVGNADEEVKQAVAAHGGVLLNARASEGIRELLGVCMWQSNPSLQAI